MLEIDPNSLAHWSWRISALPFGKLQSAALPACPVRLLAVQFLSSAHTIEERNTPPFFFLACPILSPISMVHISRPAKTREQSTGVKGERVTRVRGIVGPASKHGGFHVSRWWLRAPSCPANSKKKTPDSQTSSFLAHENCFFICSFNPYGPAPHDPSAYHEIMHMERSLNDTTAHWHVGR